MDLQKLQRVVVDALEDVKAQDIKVFNTIGISDMFDSVILASGTSNRQTRALAWSVVGKVKDAGGTVVSVEGTDPGEWVLVDLGDVVVHIMQPAIRDYYGLEEMWGSKPLKVKLASERRSNMPREAEPVAAAAPAAPPPAAKARKAAKKLAGESKRAKSAKSAAKKAPAGKVSAKKAPAKKAPAKKSLAKKAPAKKAAKKAATKVATKAAKTVAKKAPSPSVRKSRASKPAAEKIAAKRTAKATKAVKTAKAAKPARKRSA